MDIQELKNLFGECDIYDEKIVIKSRMHDALVYVVSEYSFDILKSITAVDWGKNVGVELIYRLYSTINEEDFCISIISQGEAESVVDIFKSAQADENEIYDLFGIKFINNKNLKRLYLPESWEGYPLRKDYVQTDMRIAWNENENDI